MKNNTQVLTEQYCKQKDETIFCLRFYVALEISSGLLIHISSPGCRKVMLKLVLFCILATASHVFLC